MPARFYSTPPPAGSEKFSGAARAGSRRNYRFGNTTTTDEYLGTSTVTAVPAVFA